MKADIKLRYSNKENDLEVVWEVGHKHSAGYILDLFSKEVQNELKNRGYDLKTLKFSINKKMEKNKMIDGECVDENLMYIDKHYNLNLKKGDKVLALDVEGKVVGGTNYVYIKHSHGISSYHPQDIEVQDAKLTALTGSEVEGK